MLLGLDAALLGALKESKTTPKNKKLRAAGQKIKIGK
jgi:hypothetical protein